MADGHLLFVWKTSGYELREGDGDVPGVGAEVEQEDSGTRMRLVVPVDGESD